MASQSSHEAAVADKSESAASVQMHQREDAESTAAAESIADAEGTSNADDPDDLQHPSTEFPLVLSPASDAVFKVSPYAVATLFAWASLELVFGRWSRIAWLVILAQWLIISLLGLALLRWGIWQQANNEMNNDIAILQKRIAALNEQTKQLREYKNTSDEARIETSKLRSVELQRWTQDLEFAVLALELCKKEKGGGGLVAPSTPKGAKRPPRKKNKKVTADECLAKLKERKHQIEGLAKAAERLVELMQDWSANSEQLCEGIRKAHEEQGLEWKMPGSGDHRDSDGEDDGSSLSFSDIGSLADGGERYASLDAYYKNTKANMRGGEEACRQVKQVGATDV